MANGNSLARVARAIITHPNVKVYVPEGEGAFTQAAHGSHPRSETGGFGKTPPALGPEPSGKIKGYKTPRGAPLGPPQDGKDTGGVKVARAFTAQNFLNDADKLPQPSKGKGGAKRGH
jgi:hypothetical protein